MSKLSQLDLALQCCEKRAWESDPIPIENTQFVLYIQNYNAPIIIDFTLTDKELDAFRDKVKACKMTTRRDRRYPYQIFSDRNSPNHDTQMERLLLIRHIEELANQDESLLKYQFGLLVCVNNIQWQQIKGVASRTKTE